MRKTALLLGVFALLLTAKPFEITTQGSFTIGGSYIEYEGKFSAENFISPDGQRAYGDFAYVKFQTPVNAKNSRLYSARRTVEMALTRYLCVTDIACIC